MRRLLAVIGAVVIVAGSMAVRSMIDDDRGGVEGGDGELVVVCDVDVTEACEALEGIEVRSAPAASTATAIDQGALDGVDVWITTSAWSEVVESRAPDAVGPAQAIASSPVVVAALPGRGEALTSRCGDRPLLRCVGDAAGQPWAELDGQARWGRLTAGFPDPDSGIGLAVLAAATSGYFGDSAFARNDFDADAGFRPWIDGLYAEAPVASPVRTMVTAQGMFSVAGDVRARAVLDAGQRPIELLQPDEAVTVTVVAVPLADGDSLSGLDQVRRALAEQGWEEAEGAPAPTLKPGVMAALHSLWTETR